MLESLGNTVYWRSPIPWYLYNGFLRPTCLPEAAPMISEEQARAAVKLTGAPFARWERPIEKNANSSWWQTNRTGPYGMSDLSANTRSKIRRGRKRLEARKPTLDEVRNQGNRLFRAAASRYGATGRVPGDDYPEILAKTVENHPEHFDLFAVFRADQMVALSENHLQSGGVLFESIWLEPKALRDYSSYLLFDVMLENYLNIEKNRYVSDGVRTLHHNTGVHDFLIEKFGFQREPAQLHVVYQPVFSMLVYCAYPFRRMISQFNDSFSLNLLQKAEGILLQESIRRLDCVDEPLNKKISDKFLK